MHLLPKPSYPWHVIYACELSESARLRALSHSSSSVYSFVDFVSFAHLCLSTWLSVHKISFGKKTFPSQLYSGGGINCSLSPDLLLSFTHRYAHILFLVCQSVCLFVCFILSMHFTALKLQIHNTDFSQHRLYLHIVTQLCTIFLEDIQDAQRYFMIENATIFLYSA